MSPDLFLFFACSSVVSIYAVSLVISYSKLDIMQRDIRLNCVGLTDSRVLPTRISRFLGSWFNSGSTLGPGGLKHLEEKPNITGIYARIGSKSICGVLKRPNARIT